MKPRLTEGKLLTAYVGLDDRGRCCSQIDDTAITWAYRLEHNGQSMVCQPMLATAIVAGLPDAIMVPFACRLTRAQKNTISIIAAQISELRRRRADAEAQLLPRLTPAPWDT